MNIAKKNLKTLLIFLSLFFIILSSPLYYGAVLKYTIPDSNELLLRTLFIFLVYAILFYQVYKSRKTKHATSLIFEIIGMAFVTSAFIAIPVFYARISGMISEEISYAYILQVNVFFALLLSIVVHLSKYISCSVSKIIFFICINTVFIFNCLTIAVLYSTGFGIGPTVMLHLSWEATKVGFSDHYILLLLLLVFLIPVNFAFSKLLRNHKDSVINYTVVSLAAIAIFANATIFNFATYKVKKTFPVYSLADTFIQYSNSSLFTVLDSYKEVVADSKELEALSSIGIQLEKQTNKQDVFYPTNKINLITIYLESFQLDFTRHGGTRYPGLTPNLNALSNDYVVYSNFINSVTPTINAMISSQCGENIVLSDDAVIPNNNNILDEDPVAKFFFKNNLYCLSDILNTAGYYQVMMKGADINFSGKGEFFKSHGYDQALGRDELNKNNQYTELNSWGLQDPMLIQEALNKLNSLKNKQPFNLTFLTLNSHAPGFEYSGCPIYKAGNTLLNGIHCTDYALGIFLNKLKTMDLYKNTAVVILGDHVLFNSVTNHPLSTSWYGRTYLAIRTPPQTDIKHTPTIFGTTPDIAPTILDILGFKNFSFIAGKSLINERKDYQRITATGFDIYNNKMIPENVADVKNKCTILESNSVKIYGTGLYNSCQRAKIHYLEQKAIFNKTQDKLLNNSTAAD